MHCSGLTAAAKQSHMVGQRTSIEQFLDHQMPRVRTA